MNSYIMIQLITVTVEFALILIDSLLMKPAWIPCIIHIGNLEWFLLEIEPTPQIGLSPENGPIDTMSA